MPYQCMLCMKSFRYKVSQRTHKCIAQPTSSPPTDPHQHVSLSNNEGRISCDESHSLPSLSTVSLTNPERPSKELENYNLSVCLSSEELHQGGNYSSHSENSSLLLSSKCVKPGNASSPTDCPSQSHMLCNLSQLRDFNDFFSLSPNQSRRTLKADQCDSNLNLGKNLTSVVAHDNVDVTQTVSQPPVCTLSASAHDFNDDLFHDIFSMVMSPSPESTPSPSSQLRQLSLTGGQNDDDFESGLELRQLLYGPSDTESTQ